MMTTFAPATPKPPHSIALCGGSGAGKTRTALHIAAAISHSIAVVDCGERGSAAGYSAYVPHDIAVLPSPLSLKEFHAALDAASAYEVVVIDSLSEIWLSILRYKEGLDSRGNSFANWGKAGKLWERALYEIQNHPARVIVTARAKHSYVLETNAQGKQEPRSVGLQPVLRDGTEYAFDVWCLLADNTLSVVQPRHNTNLEGLVLDSPTISDCRVFV